jgi:hypothetical protein
VDKPWTAVDKPWTIALLADFLDNISRVFNIVAIGEIHFRT